MKNNERSGQRPMQSDNLAIITHRMVLRELLNGIKRVSPPNPQHFGQKNVDDIRTSIRAKVQSSAFCLKEFGHSLSQREQVAIMAEVEAITHPLAQRDEDS